MTTGVPRIRPMGGYAWDSVLRCAALTAEGMRTITKTSRLRDILRYR
jgi:hypothetical protein